MQQLRRLSTDRRARRADGAFVLEGPNLVEEALDGGVTLEAIFAEPDAPVAVVDRARDAGVEVREVRAGALAGATDAVTSQGVAAIATRPEHRLDDVRAGLAVFVLVGIADPGNAGTLVRVAEAAGLAAVIFTAGSVDPWSPKAVRASAGSVLRVPVISGGEAGSVLDEIRATGRPVIGTRTEAAPLYRDADLPVDAAIVLGNEAHGLPDDADSRIDGWVRIPMLGRVESLNVAMAGTVLAFELRRRWDHEGG